jgi:hypothetical protein
MKEFPMKILIRFKRGLATLAGMTGKLRAALPFCRARKKISPPPLFG